MARISIIVATDLSGGIGLDGKLPWPKFPEDMQRFREKTMGHVVVMGRKTYESIGKPLVGRTNVVLSRDGGYTPTGVIVERTIGLALAHPSVVDRPVWVIGGAEVYELGLPYADTIEQTAILEHYPCDRLFPLVALGEWRESWWAPKATSVAGFRYQFRRHTRVIEPTHLDRE